MIREVGLLATANDATTGGDSVDVYGLGYECRYLCEVRDKANMGLFLQQPEVRTALATLHPNQTGSEVP